LRVRLENAQRVSEELEKLWDQREVMDPTTHHLLSYTGLKCRVLGTFYVSELRGGTGVRHVLTSGSDLSNYYPNQGLKVFKPRSDAVERIVNYLRPFTHSIGAPLDRRGGPLFSRSEARLPAESRQLGSPESRRTSSSRQTAPG